MWRGCVRGLGWGEAIGLGIRCGGAGVEEVSWALEGYRFRLGLWRGAGGVLGLGGVVGLGWGSGGGLGGVLGLGGFFFTFWT